jgi:hypothetical protein
MDKHGYPTKKELNKLKLLGDNNFEAFILLLQELWQWDNCIKYKTRGKRFWLELHTGGWSGNESIINIIQETFFWFLYWQKSERGGHYWLKGKIFIVI